MIELEKLHETADSRLRSMVANGYSFELLAPNYCTKSATFNPNNLTVVARSDRPPKDPVKVDISLPDATVRTGTGCGPPLRLWTGG